MAITATNLGLGIITNLLKGVGTSPNYVDWGIGSGAASVTDTGLNSAGAEARTLGTMTQEQDSTLNDTYKVVGAITCTGGSKAITEVGLFTDLASGQLFMRSSFEPINVEVGDSITFSISNVLDQA